MRSVAPLCARERVVTEGYDVRHRFVIVSVAVVAAAAFTYFLSAPITAQAPARTQSYVPPRTADGQPDLQGVWRAWNLAKYRPGGSWSQAGCPGRTRLRRRSTGRQDPVSAVGDRKAPEELRGHQDVRSCQERRIRWRNVSSPAFRA